MKQSENVLKENDSACTYGVRSILKELAYARGKHQNFADILTNDTDRKFVKNALMLYRKLNSAHPYSAKDILFEEIYEGFDAYLKKEYAHAFQEFAQCGAVILRIMAMLSNEAYDLYGSKDFAKKFRDTEFVNGDSPDRKEKP